MTFSELVAELERETKGDQAMCNRCLLKGKIGTDFRIGLNVTSPAEAAPAFFFVNCVDKTACDQRRIPLKKFFEPL